MQSHPRFVSLVLLLLILSFFLPSAFAKAELTIKGVEYTSLKTVAGRLGMKRTWLSAKKTAALHSSWTRLEFRVHKRYLLINQIKVYMGYPVAYHRSDLYISQLDFELTLAPLLTPQTFPNVPKLTRIVIDPGHGGKDTGALNKKQGIMEKTVVLDLSKRLRKVLQSRGYEVTLTRENDKFISLSQRPALAKRLAADLFVSIHANAAEDKSVRGVETYALTPRNQPSTKNHKLHSSARKSYAGNGHDPWNLLVGYYVQRGLVERMKNPDRGLKRARFAVLKPLNCPGLLVETGFLSNTHEAQKLNSSTYRQRLAEVIAEGIAYYQKTLNRLRSPSTKQFSPPRPWKALADLPTAPLPEDLIQNGRWLPSQCLSQNPRHQGTASLVMTQARK